MKKYMELIVLIAILVIYGLATYQRNLLWKDEMTLWSDIVKKSPNKARAYNNLGLAYLHNKGCLKAIAYFKQALQLNPYFSYAHFNLGIAYQSTGLYDRAIAEYKKVLHGSSKPYFANIHNNLGVCYFNKGRINMAIEEFRQALKVNPNFSDARFNLGIALQKKRRTKEP